MKKGYVYWRKAVAFVMSFRVTGARHHVFTISLHVFLKAFVSIPLEVPFPRAIREPFFECLGEILRSRNYGSRFARSTDIGGKYRHSRSERFYDYHAVAIVARGKQNKVGIWIICVRISLSRKYDSFADSFHFGEFFKFLALTAITHNDKT